MRLSAAIAMSDSSSVGDTVPGVQSDEVEVAPSRGSWSIDESVSFPSRSPLGTAYTCCCTVECDLIDERQPGLE